jgi:hypothetical protein
MYIHANSIYLRVKSICLMNDCKAMTESKHLDDGNIRLTFPKLLLIEGTSWHDMGGRIGMSVYVRFYQDLFLSRS